MAEFVENGIDQNALQHILTNAKGSICQGGKVSL